MLKNQKHSEESKRKMSEAKKGANNPFYGQHLSKEHKLKLSKAKSGERHYLYGKHPSKEAKAKMSEVKRGVNNSFYGKYHSEETKQKLREINIGKHHSEEVKQRFSAMRQGKDNGNWKGGITKQSGYHYLMMNKRRALIKQATGSFTLEEWEHLKAEYNYTCPLCGLKEPEIKVTIDHIIPLSRKGPNSIENIQPLCRSCNSKKHTEIFKAINRVREINGVQSHGEWVG